MGRIVSGGFKTSQLDTLEPPSKTGGRIISGGLKQTPAIEPKFTGQTSFMQETLIKPAKTFYGGTLKASANLADTLDFYSDKIAKKLNMPETKNSIFEYLKKNWATEGERLEKEGLSEGVVKKIHSGLGQAAFEVPKLMTLGPGALAISGAAEGYKEGGVRGAFTGGITGGLMKGAIKGIQTLPAIAKYPTAFATGATTTPGDLKEKVASGTVFTALSAGRSPSMREFKETQGRFSPLLKGYEKIFPAEKREGIYQSFVNRMQSIENIVDKAKNLGAKILPGENPALRARTYLGIGQKVKTVLEDKTYKITPEGKLEITGEGLKPILDNYGKISPEKNSNIRDKDLNNYLIATRTIKDLQRPKSEWTTEQIVTSEQVKKAQDIISNLGKKYGANLVSLDQTATRLYNYQKRVLSNLVDSGNLSQEQYNAILAKNPNYVPFDRVLENIEPTGGTPISKGRFTGARSPLKRIKGSELEIHNPIESMIKNTYRIMDIAERNTVSRSVAKLSEVLPEDISPVKIKMVPVAEVEHRAAVDQSFISDLASFAKELGAKFKTTGQPGKQLGVYYPSGKQITRKFATPREVMAHETAHFFDDKFSLKQKFYKRGESKAVTEELLNHMQRMGESQNRMNKPAERFADGFEWWLTHRDLAQRDLPLFSKTMGGIIKDIPALSPVLKIEPQPGISLERMKETIFAQSQFKPKGNVIEYFDNGKRSYIEVTPNLYQAMTGLNETSTSLLTKIMSIPAGTLRVGATITPEFMLRNPIRDQWTAFMQTKLGFKPFVDASGAIADIVGKSEAYNDWLRSGGAYSGFVELSRPNLQKMLKDLQGKPDLLKNLNIITKAQDISQLFEQATRLGVYKAGVKKGLTPIEAGFESREATIDFARRGAKIKDINSVIAFFNAGIQGTDKLVRTAKEDPAGFAAKGIATITIPSLITYLLNRNDPEYKELPRWQKDLFWIFKVRDTFIRIPKPFAYGQIFGSLPERFMEYLEKEDPGAFEGLQKSLYDSLLPTSGDPVGGIMATGVKPLIENATNWSFFRQQPIVSEGKERLLPEKQYGRYTSETAKFIGKLINYSPAKTENLVQGWFGGSGRYALQMGDVVGRGIAKFTGRKIEPKKPSELADIPLVKGFVTRPALSQSESVNQFYTNRDRIIKAYSTMQKYIKEGNRAEANRIQSKYPEYKFYQGFNRVSKALSDLRAYEDIVVKSDKSEKEKRELLQRIDKQMVNIAQKANQYLKR